MTPLRDVELKDTSYPYKWLFNNHVLRMLARQIHSTASSASNDLGKLIFNVVQEEKVDSIIPNLDKFLRKSTMSDSVFIADKQQIKESTTLEPAEPMPGSRPGFRPDFMVFNLQGEPNICHNVKLKYGPDVTSKEALGTSQAMHNFIKSNSTASRIKYQHEARFCVFNLDSDRTETDTVHDEVITGDQFCTILGIDYNDVMEEQRNICQDNEEFLLSELIRSGVVPKQMLEKRISELLDDKDALSGAQRAAAKLFKNLQEDWKLSKEEMASLLGKDPEDSTSQKYVKNLLEEACLFDERDTNERMARLIQIREALFALFRDHKKENEWLRQEQKSMGGRVLIKLLLDGSKKSLYRVQEFVEAAARW